MLLKLVLMSAPLLLCCRARVFEDLEEEGNRTVVEGKTLDQHRDDIYKNITTFVKQDP